MGATNEDIMERIGGLSAEVKQAERSRRVMHEKLDKTVDIQHETMRLVDKVSAGLQWTNDIASKALAHSEAAHTKIDTFVNDFEHTKLPVISQAAAFKIEAEPLLKTMKTIRTVVIGFGVLWTMGGISVGYLLYTSNEWAKTLFRWWLGL